MFNEDINSLLNFIACITDIDFNIYDQFGNCDNPTSLTKGYIANHLDFVNTHLNNPVISSNDSGLQYISVSDCKYNHYVLGPYVSMAFSDSDIESLLNHNYSNNLSVQERNILRDKLSDLPILEQNTAFQFCVMLYYAVNHQKTPFSSIVFDGDILKDDAKQKDDNLFITSYQLEKQTYDNIKNGEKANFEKLFNYANVIRYRNIYPANILRSRKDLSLFFIGLSGHAAIEAGLDISTVYSKQAHYTTLIENANSDAKISQIEIQIFEDFSSATHNLLKTNDDNSDFVRKVDAYINANLYNPISIDDLANYFKLSKYYLSKRFFKETGIKLVDYINRQKMDAARDLLKYTNYSISEIADQLAYPNLSYFCHLFKQITSVTCGEYRNTRHFTK